MAQAQLVLALRFAIDQLLEPEPLHESLQFAVGHRLLHQVDEMRLDAAFRKESLRLAGVGALFHPEDLHFHA